MVLRRRSRPADRRWDNGCRTERRSADEKAVDLTPSSATCWNSCLDGGRPPALPVGRGFVFMASGAAQLPSDGMEDGVRV
jgi:hypothetical protein